MQSQSLIHYVAVVAIFAIGFATAKPFVEGWYGRSLLGWTKRLFGLAQKSPTTMVIVIFANNYFVYSVLLSLSAIKGGPLWLLPLIGANMFVLTKKAEELTAFIQVKPIRHLPGPAWFLAMAGFLALEVGTLVAGAAHSLEQSLSPTVWAERFVAAWDIFGWAGAATLLTAALLETVAIWMPPEPMEDEPL